MIMEVLLKNKCEINIISLSNKYILKIKINFCLL
jgi:hypothetical protein